MSDENATLTSAAAKDTGFVRWFGSLSIDDVPEVGGKNASLGEMVRELGARGVRVPNGFATTANGFRCFLRDSGCGERIERLLVGLDVQNVGDLARRGREIRHEMLSAPLPEELEHDIVAAYLDLSKQAGSNDVGASVAVRSSATAEDLPSASFAGQQETFLNVVGVAPLLEACKRCFASLYTDRAISYRVDRGFDHDSVALSIGVQLMVRSDLDCSGVMFSIDPETGFERAVLISASYGLGETVVQGSVNPDEFYVFKTTLQQGKRPILSKKLGSKELKLVNAEGGSKLTRIVPVVERDRSRFCVGDDDLLELARWACIIEEHYSKKHGKTMHMDIEWAKDGPTGELFIVQARPETVQSQRSVTVQERFELRQTGEVLTTGSAVGQKIGQGRVRLIESPEQMGLLEQGEVLVTSKTDPDWEPIMKRASAIVTDQGGRTCHAAIVSRELGVPAVVGCGNAREALENGAEVTVSCAEGELGKIYRGKLAFDVTEFVLDDKQRPRTKIMMNIANPNEAFRLAAIPNDGVGLAREEFIISNFIEVHPLALADHPRLDDPVVRSKIDELIVGYPDASSFFVEKLSQGVAMIAAAFHPKPVIVRLSDFKSNEYRHLIGGEAYEPIEQNPMLGFRGASRYYDERYRRGFELECRALLRVRRDMGLTNVKIMVPFCRTVAEGRLVQAEMARHGLRRGKDDLEIYLMCELPANVVRAGDFGEIFDGFSIGSNDLTQLTLGLDRDSEIVAHLFDERDEAVESMVRMAIRSAHEAGRKIGICGQAPSDYPEYARFLIEAGIDSLSLNPDVVLETTARVLAAEQEQPLSNEHAGGSERRATR